MPSIELTSGHRYLVDGKPCPGVTTVLGIVDKPALKFWFAKKAIEFVVSNWSFFKDRSVDEVKELFFQALKHPERETTKSANMGNLAHKQVELIAKGLITLEQADQQVSHITSEFVRWCKEEEFVLEQSEVKLISQLHWYAGTADLVCRLRRIKWLSDLKSGKSIYPEMGKQLAGYRGAYLEMSPELPPIEKMGILRIGYERKDFEVEEFEDYEFHYDWFLKNLALYNAEKEGEKRWELKHPESKWKKKAKAE